MKKITLHKGGRGVLAVCLAGSMLFTRPMQVSAVRSISEIEEEQSSIQSELNGLDADMVSLVTDMTDLESQITSKTQEIADAEATLAEAQAAVDQQYASMKVRIQYMYENSDENIMTVLLESGSISDFLNRLENINAVYTYDRTVLGNYQAAKDEVEDLKASLEEEKASLEANKTQLANQQAQLNAMISEKQGEMADIKSELADAKALAARQAELERQRQLAALTNNTNSSNNGGSGNTGGNTGGSTNSGGNLNPSNTTGVSGSAVVAFANQYDSLEKRILEELALPYAIMDMNGRMIWSNKVFAELTGKDQFYKKNVSTVFPDVTADKLPVADKKETAEISTRFGEKTYRISMQRVSLGEVVAKSEFLENSNRNVSLIAMYLYDDTELKSYIKKNEDNKLVVALAYLDNYEEALESVEDVRRSLLIALIDRKITKYFSNFDGLVKKLEKDKYFLIMRQSSLEALKEQRFHILDEVKTVNIGNEMAITLSIGVGLNASTYIQNYEYSRIAIEMALGRGGDQVVIKNGNNITYYGGKTQQMEKNTRVKARVKAQALKEFMSTKDRVVVMGHKITDVDALGAAIGIFRAGKTLGKSVSIVVNDPTKSIRPLIAGYVNNPDYEPSMFVDSEQAKDMVDNNTVVVVVDTNRPSYTECDCFV